jgi:hypothetical protein
VGENEFLKTSKDLLRGIEVELFSPPTLDSH